MLAHALTAFGKTHASQRSFNNHIGVPITLATLAADCDFAVQEMGMNAAGEIAALTALARPDIALITRIASTHGGFFDSLDDIAKAKAEIFEGLNAGGTAILNIDDPFYDQLASAATKAGAGRIISFGRKDDAEFCLLEARQHEDGMTVHAEIAGRELRFEMQMHGIHWAQNALGVLACIDALGLSVDEAAARLASCPTPKGRGGRLSGRYQDCKITLIDDSYNASPASMAAAFASMTATAPTIMILSEMRELGDATATEHAALMPQINGLSPRLVIALGSAMHDALDGLDDAIAAIAAPDTQAAVQISKMPLKMVTSSLSKDHLGRDHGAFAMPFLPISKLHHPRGIITKWREQPCCLTCLFLYPIIFSPLTCSAISPSGQVGRRSQPC